MVFSSVTFLLYFLPLFLLVYFISPKKIKNWVILAFSIFFYSWGAPKFIFILLLSTIVDFYLVKSMYNTIDKGKKKVLLISSIVLNVGLLAYFKYANFFIENVNYLLESFGKFPVEWVEVILPIGISFYTFQTLTYSLDIYNNKHKPLVKLQDYLLYILSFPQMIAGPIVRFNEIADQIEDRKELYEDKIYGFFRFCIGLSKKVLIANVLGEKADEIFSLQTNELDSGLAWVGILAYTFQIYFDFSGYSDMAIGLGRLMGFKFPENFNNPYTATSITDFWKRWHMTLGQWMKDYLYIPLGGNKVKTKSRLYANLITVFLISGLWHGASWNFIIWGGFHGLFLILDRLFLHKILSKLGRVPSVFITFIIVVYGWVFFRIENFNDAIEYIKIMNSFNFDFALNLSDKFIVISLLAVMFSIVTLVKFGEKIEHYIFSSLSFSLRNSILFSILGIVLFVLSIAAITTKGFNPFIYFRF